MATPLDTLNGYGASVEAPAGTATHCVVLNTGGGRKFFKILDAPLFDGWIHRWLNDGSRFDLHEHFTLNVSRVVFDLDMPRTSAVDGARALCTFLDIVRSVTCEVFVTRRSPAELPIVVLKSANTTQDLKQGYHVVLPSVLVDYRGQAWKGYLARVLETTPESIRPHVDTAIYERGWLRMPLSSKYTDSLYTSRVGDRQLLLHRVFNVEGIPTDPLGQVLPPPPQPSTARRHPSQAPPLDNMVILSISAVMPWYPCESSVIACAFPSGPQTTTQLRPAALARQHLGVSSMDDAQALFKVPKSARLLNDFVQNQQPFAFNLFAPCVFRRDALAAYQATLQADPTRTFEGYVTKIVKWLNRFLLWDLSMRTIFCKVRSAVNPGCSDITTIREKDMNNPNWLANCTLLLPASADDYGLSLETELSLVKRKRNDSGDEVVQGKQIKLSKIWLEHAARGEADCSHFNPVTCPPFYQTYVVVAAPSFNTTRVFNTFGGFAITPSMLENVCFFQDEPEGPVHYRSSVDLSDFHEFVYNVWCCRDVQRFVLVYRWIAMLLQRPGELFPVVLFLIGNQGIGKSFLHRFLSLIVGQRYSLLGRMKPLFGEKFNHQLARKVFVGIDEAQVDDATLDTVKIHATEPTLHFNPKGRDQYQDKNNNHIFITSDKSTEALRSDQRERRFFILMAQPPIEPDRQRHINNLCARLESADGLFRDNLAGFFYHPGNINVQGMVAPDCRTMACNREYQDGLATHRTVGSLVRNWFRSCLQHGLIALHPRCQLLDLVPTTDNDRATRGSDDQIARLRQSGFHTTYLTDADLAYMTTAEEIEGQTLWIRTLSADRLYACFRLWLNSTRQTHENRTITMSVEQFLLEFLGVCPLATIGSHNGMVPVFSSDLQTNMVPHVQKSITIVHLPHLVACKEFFEQAQNMTVAPPQLGSSAGAPDEILERRVDQLMWRPVPEEAWHTLRSAPTQVTNSD